MPSEIKCYTICPDSYYTDYNQNFCNRCHYSCVTCRGPKINDCITCNSEQGFYINNGYCIREGCPELYEQLDNNSCLSIFQCIENAQLSLPKIFNIELNPLIAKFDFKIKDKCLKYQKGFSLKGNSISTLYQKAILSGDNTTLRINNDDLIEGELYLNVDLIYKDKLISGDSQTSLLVLNKVNIFSQGFFYDF